MGWLVEGRWHVARPLLVKRPGTLKRNCRTPQISRPFDPAASRRNQAHTPFWLRVRVANCGVDVEPTRASGPQACRALSPFIRSPLSFRSDCDTDGALE